MTEAEITEVLFKRDPISRSDLFHLLRISLTEVAIDKAQADARKAFGTFEQGREAHRLAGEMVQARKAAEKAAAGEAAPAAKAETSKAELELMKAEIAYRVAHAQ